MSGLFGSKNRRHFRFGVEKKQTANGENTNEKYRSYNEKKRHEADLWAELILSGFDTKFAERVEILYKGWGVEEYTTKCIIQDYTQVVQLIQRVIPDKNCVVTGLNNRQVRLTTLKDKGLESRSVKKLTEAGQKARKQPQYAYQMLCSFLEQLAGYRTDEAFLIDLEDITFKDLDLISLLGKALLKATRSKFNLYIRDQNGCRTYLNEYQLLDDLTLVDGDKNRLLRLK